jgi:hypothetical protein
VLTDSSGTKSFFVMIQHYHSTPSLRKFISAIGDSLAQSLQVRPDFLIDSTTVSSYPALSISFDLKEKGKAWYTAILHGNEIFVLGYANSKKINNSEATFFFRSFQFID